MRNQTCCTSTTILQDFQPQPALWPEASASGCWLKARGRMIIGTFGERFLPHFYALLLRCWPQPKMA